MEPFSKSIRVFLCTLCVSALIFFGLYGRKEKGEPDGSPHQNHNDTRTSLPLFTSVISRAGNADPGRFIKAILWVEERRRAQMQGAGHPITEVTGRALGLVRFIITDVTNPGGSFHVVAAAHAFSRVKFLILRLSSIMHLPEDKGKRLRSKKGIVVDD
jgi:hypothetical protein